MNQQLLEAARINDVDRFLFASSACIYRQEHDGLNKFSEDQAIPANPHSTYGWAKILGEVACRAYHTDTDLATGMVRIFNCYGPKESLDPTSSHVIPSLCRKVIEEPDGGSIEVFGDVPLASSVRPTMIPVYDIDHDVPYFFRAHRARADAVHAFRMRDVVRAATAAPAYFPPGRVNSAAGHTLSCIDGGVVAFNPALWAYLEARELWPDNPDVVVASFGQTRRDHGLRYDKVLGWGRVNWVSPIFELMCDAGSVSVNAQVRRLIEDAPERPRYFRFDALIDRPKIATLDDLSDQNLRTVRAASRDLLQRESAKFDRLCRRLTAG
jgi:hypothetical protein